MNIKTMIYDKLKEKDRVIIAIDGQCGSGKTTLASKLQEEFDALLIHMDDYFLPPEMKTKERLSESGGNVHYERIQSEVFDHIHDSFIKVRKFNCNTNQLEDSKIMENKRVVIIEGSYSLHKNLRNDYDIKVFMKIDYKTQLKRIESRSGKKLLERFINEWIPLENVYFETERMSEIADIVIEN